MKLVKRITIAVLCFILFFTFTACDNNTDSDSIVDDNNGAAEVAVPDGKDMFTDADKNAEYDSSSINEIELNENGVQTGETTAITEDDGLITISSAGIYKIKGSGKNVTIVVNSPDEKVVLILSDLTIENENFSCIYVKSADKTFITLEGENYLFVTGEFQAIDENKADGVIFAKDNITVQGSGSLTVKSSKHGIIGKDDVKFTGGTVKISAVSHGIQANDSVRIATANLNVSSGKDCVHIETDDEDKGFFYMESGSLDFTAGGDGIDASGSVNIVGGSIIATVGGGSDKTISSDDSSMKGIKADGDVYISCGEILLDCADDGIHSNGSIKIDDGTIEIKSGDDGVHADTSLVICRGDISVKKSYEGLEGKNVSIFGGCVTLKASDDGINAAGGNDGSSLNGRPGQNSFNTDADTFINISGGEIYVNADGDGVDSNGNVFISGGYTIVEGPTSDGDGALDYDGKATISGGVFVAIGSSGMAMNFSSATQGSILVNFSSQKANTQIILKKSSEKVIFSYNASKKYSSVLISSPDLSTGETYTLAAGTTALSITLSTYLYGGSSMSGGEGTPGGRPGGRTV